MAATEWIVARETLLKQAVELEMTLEEQNSAGSERKEEHGGGSLSKAWRKRDIPTREHEQNVSQEIQDGPSKNWDAQLQQFLKTLQDFHSVGENQLPGQRSGDDSKVPREPSGRGREDKLCPRRLWASQMHPKCTGEVPQDQKTNTDAVNGVKEEVESALDSAVRVDSQRLLFRELCYEEAEGPQALCQQLEELCCQWLKPEKHTKGEIVGLIVLEQFLDVLPSDMQMWVKGYHPQSCVEAVALSQDFLLRQKEARGWDKQTIAVSAKELDNFSQADPAVPDTDQAQRFVEVKQEASEGSTAILADGGWLRDNEEKKPALECHGQMKELRILLKSLDKKDFRHWRETERDPNRTEKQNGNDHGREKSLDRLGFRQGSCQSVSEGLNQKCDGQEAKPGDGLGKCLTAPESRHREEKSYKCCQCGQHFSNSSDLLAHERSHVGEKLYRCSHCGERERIRPGQSSHKCSHCGNNFGWIPQRATQVAEESYSCSECGKSYRYRSVFLKHLKIHRGEKLYKCTLCGENFQKRSDLKVHRRIHRGDKPYKPYKCSHCGTCFTWSSQFISCQKVYAAVCSLCGKGFNEKSELMEHETTHTAGEPFACFLCGRSFDVSSELITHVQTHTEKCSVCGETFRNSL